MGRELKNTFVYHYFKGDRAIDHRALLLASLRGRLRGRTPVVGWLLCGDERVGSSRIHGFNVSRELNKLGVASYVIQRPRSYRDDFRLDYYTQRKLLSSRLAALVFQRVHHNAGDFVRRLRAAGTRSVFIMADYFQTEMPRLCDRVIVVSDALKQFLVEDGIAHDKIDVIPDAVETDPSLCKRHDSGAARKIRVVWVGNEGHWWTLDPVREALADPRLADFELVTISAHPEASIRWDLKTVWREILGCDLAVVPADTATKEGRAKSNNRVTMFKALGLPVICSPLPSYQKVISHGVSGYLAEKSTDWARCLLLLREGTARAAVGLAGREDILREYSLPATGLRYRRALLGNGCRFRDGAAPADAVPRKWRQGP